MQFFLVKTNADWSCYVYQVVYDNHNSELNKINVPYYKLNVHYSPDAKWPYPAKACFGVIMNFYDWFIILDTSWVGIRRMPAWHPWGIFLEGKNKMATQP